MFDVALVAQNLLRSAGLQARLEVLEWTTQLDNYYNGNFQLMAFGYSGRTDPVQCEGLLELAGTEAAALAG